MALDNIFIGVITYKRPKGLQRLLEGLAALRFTEPHPPVTVIVVDNDATGAMSPLIDAVRPTFPWTLQYAVHPEAGIPFARNRVVQETGGRDGVLIFIDDDEIPEPEWADRLLAKYRATGAEAILGPVAPIYETPPEDWIVQGRFFGKTFSGTGEVPYGSTANVLIDMKVFNSMGLSFDPRLRFTGGEDTLLFMQMKKKGGRMLWEPGALVSETVPTSRANAKWLVSRKFREGNTFILAEKLAGASLGRQAGLLLSGLMRAVGGALLSLVSLSGPTEKRVDAKARMMRGLGMLNAFAGRRYDEYKKIHGS